MCVDSFTRQLIMLTTGGKQEKDKKQETYAG